MPRVEGCLQGGVEDGAVVMVLPDQVSLEVASGPSKDEKIPIIGASTTIGRQPGNHIVVSDTGISRQHAEIVKTDNGYYLRDLKSTNGTFVNSNRIDAGDHPLTDGDNIRLGASETTYIFRDPAARTLEATMIQQVVDPTSGATQVVDLGGAAAAPPPEQAAEPAMQEGVYEGTVRLSVVVEGVMGLVVSFTQQLRERQEFRLLRLANNRTGGVDIWLALRQPMPLTVTIGEMDGVESVAEIEGGDRDSEGDESILGVKLGSGANQGTSNDNVACVNCKKPLSPGTAICPSCRKSQT